MADGWYWTPADVCPVCGKHFWITERKQWAYRKSKYNTKKTDSETVYFCSWRCLRKYEIRPDMTEKETR